MWNSSIVLAFNATDPSLKGKLDILQVGGSGQTKGMLQVAKECGITRPIIDVAAMPLGAGSGATIRSVPTIKGKLGLPVGGGFHNMASSWGWFRKFKKTQPDPKAIYMPTDIGTNLVAQIAGADLPSLWPYRERQRRFSLLSQWSTSCLEKLQRNLASRSQIWQTTRLPS